MRVARLLVGLCDRVEDCEACARGSLGIVVVRRWPTEVSHHPVAEIFRHVAIEAYNRFGGSAMVAGDCLSPFLRVQLSSDRGGANQVTEQHRQMAPLASYRARLNGRRLGDGAARGSAERRAAISAEFCARCIVRITVRTA